MEPVDAYRADALLALVTGTGILSPETRKQRRRRRRSQRGPTRCRPTRPTQPTRPTRPTQTDSSDPAERPDDRSRDPRVTMHVRCDLGALRRGSLGPGEVCEIPGVGPIPIERARALLGEALVDLVITDGVDVTTVVRLGPPHPDPAAHRHHRAGPVLRGPGVREAVGPRKGPLPGGLRQGGVVSYDNIAKLCHHHHQLKTHQGYRLAGGPGHWEWIAPDRPVTPKQPSRRRKKGPKAPPRPSPTGPTLFTDRE